MARSGSELIDKLAKAPPRTKAAVFAGAAVFLGLVYWYFFYSDLQDEKKQLAVAARAAAAKNEELTKRLKEYNLLVQQKKETDRLMEENRESFPASSELPSFFRHLQDKAIQAHVRLDKWTRENESPVETYVRVPVSVEVTGTFWDLVHYFKLLRETKRIISVENLFIGNRTYEGDRAVLKAKFRASTFRQADAPAGAAPGAPAAPAAPPPPAGGPPPAGRR